MPILHRIKELHDISYWDTPILRPNDVFVHAFEGDEFAMRIDCATKVGIRHETNLTSTDGHWPAKNRVVLFGVHIAYKSTLGGELFFVIDGKAMNPTLFDVAKIRHALASPYIVIEGKPWHVRLEPHGTVVESTPIRVCVLAGLYVDADLSWKE